MTRLVAALRGGAWLNATRARDYGIILFVLYLGGFAAAMVHNGAAGHGALDFTSFYAAGVQSLRHAAQVYDTAAHLAAERAVTANPHLTYSYFFYPPVLLLVLAPLALLPYWPAFLVWELGQGALYVWVLRRMAKRSWPIMPMLAFPAGLWAVIVGQNALLTTGLFGAGLWALARNREIPAGIAFGLICLKPHFGLLIPVALLAGRHWRAIFAATLTVLILAAATVPLFGFHVWPTFIHLFIGTATGIYGAAHVPPNWLMSPFGLVLALGGDRAVAWGLQGAVTVTVTMLVAAIWRNRDHDPAARAIALLSGTLLAVPVMLYYDAEPIALCLAWSALAARRTGWLPWEKSLYLAAFGISFLASPLRDILPVSPFMPLSMALMALAWRRRMVGFDGFAGADGYDPPLSQTSPTTR